jgi:hypothetical protein
MALVRKRTLPTERPPIVDEVSSNGVAWSTQRIPTVVNLGFLELEIITTRDIK